MLSEDIGGWYLGRGFLGLGCGGGLGVRLWLGCCVRGLGCGDREIGSFGGGGGFAGFGCGLGGGIDRIGLGFFGESMPVSLIAYIRDSRYTCLVHLYQLISLNLKISKRNILKCRTPLILCLRTFRDSCKREDFDLVLLGFYISFMNFRAGEKLLLDF